MIKTVDVCTRVEGHGSIKIYLKHDSVERAIFELSGYRGFESILKGKHLFDVPRIISRICGVCHAAQTIVSCKTIENMYEFDLPQQFLLLRKLLLTGELLKSHGMHFIFQAFPDLLHLLGIQTKILSPYDVIKEYPNLISNFFELVNIGNQIDKIFGGRAIHLITPIPCGVIYTPSNKKIKLAQKYFESALNNVEWIFQKMVELFSDKTPPEAFNLPKTTMMALHDHGTYNRYDGLIRIKNLDDKVIDFLSNNYTSYFSKSTDFRGIDFYSIEDNTVLVGPLARHHLVETYGKDEYTNYFEYFNDAWKNNLLFGNFIRLMEMYVEIIHSLSALQNPELNEEIPLTKLTSLKSNEGMGALEAPRGLLMHHYKINDARIITEAKLFIATELNLPLIDKMITNQSKLLYEQKGDLNLIKKEAQKMIRSFDPCISCATH